MQKNQSKAVAFGLLAVLLWSTVATAFKLGLQTHTPLQLLAIASAVSWALLAAVALYRQGLATVVSVWRSHPLRYLTLGAMNPFLYYLVLFKAYDLLPAQQASTLNYTWGLVMSLLAVPLLKQPLTRHDMGALLLGYTGAVVIATKGQVLDLQFDSLTGVGYALVSTVIWALYWLFSARDKAPAEVGLLLSFTVGTPIVWAVCIATDGLAPWSVHSWIGVYIGVFEMGLTFLIWMTAINLAERTSHVSNLIFLNPFLALLVINKVLGEAIHSATYVGLVMILLAVGWQQLAGRRERRAS